MLEVIGIVVGTVTAAGGVLWKGGCWLARRVRPFQGSYKVLRKLELGVRSAYLKGVLGESEISYEAKGDPLNLGAREAYVCEIYRRPGHVVGTLADASGSVAAIAVASCDPKFRGTVPTPLGPITLNKSTMAEVGKPSRVWYSVGGSGGFGYFALDVVDGQCNAAGYTDTLWGQVYGCCDTSARLGIQELTGSEIESYEGEYEPSLDRHRSQWITNLVILTNLPLDGDELGLTFITGVEVDVQRAATPGMRRRRRSRRPPLAIRAAVGPVS